MIAGALFNAQDLHNIVAHETLIVYIFIVLVSWDGFFAGELQ